MFPICMDYQWNLASLVCVLGLFLGGRVISSGDRCFSIGLCLSVALLLPVAPLRDLSTALGTDEMGARLTL